MKDTNKPETMGETIGRLQREAGLTQSALAERLGVTAQAVSQQLVSPPHLRGDGVPVVQCPRCGRRGRPVLSAGLPPDRGSVLSVAVFSLAPPRAFLRHPPARCYMGRGQIDNALACLEEAVVLDKEDRTNTEVTQHTDSPLFGRRNTTFRVSSSPLALDHTDFAPLRAHPRYQALLAQMQQT